MKKIILGVLSVLLLFASCTNGSEEPSSSLSEETKDDSSSVTKTSFSVTKQITASQAPAVITSATESTMIILTDCASEDEIYSIKQALFTLYDSKPSVKIGIDFSGNTSSNQSNRAVTAFQSEKNILESIPANAFYDDEDTQEGTKNLAQVIIPEGTTVIGNNAFKGCTGLEDIVISETVSDIGTNVFDDCSALTEIKIPEGVSEIKDSAFKGCTSLKQVSIPNSVTKIEDEAFYNCLALKNITIPENLTYVGKEAFKGCMSIKTISIPNSIIHIGANAFSGTALTTVKIPVSSKGIDKTAFFDCGTFKLTITSNSDQGLYNKEFEDWTGIKSVEIMPGVTSIGNDTFRNCSNLKTVELADSIKSIGTNAFTDCTSLTTCKLNEGLLDIGESAFLRSGLVSITLPSTLTKINTQVFTHCESLTDVKLSENLMTIDSSFIGCKSLKSIVIPDSVVDLGGEGGATFSDCDSLETVILGKNLIKIGVNESCFRNCKSLKSITIPANVEIIGPWSFYGCSNIEEVTFEKTDNWYYIKSKSGSTGEILEEIPLQVTNPSENANKFRNGYSYVYTWYRKIN